jgi:hypothetical protein
MKILVLIFGLALSLAGTWLYLRRTVGNDDEGLSRPKATLDQVREKGRDFEKTSEAQVHALEKSLEAQQPAETPP